MTRKDFQLIAMTIDGIRQQEEAGVTITARTVAVLFAHSIKVTNPRFDRGRFIVACGFPDHEGTA